MENSSRPTGGYKYRFDGILFNKEFSHYVTYSGFPKIINAFIEKYKNHDFTNTKEILQTLMCLSSDQKKYILRKLHNVYGIDPNRCKYAFLFPIVKQFLHTCISKNKTLFQD